MLPALVLVALVVVAGTLSCTGWVGPFALIGLSVVWVLVNHPVEGVVLLTFSTDQGLTGADLAAVAGIVVAGMRLRQLARARRRTPRNLA